MNADGAVRRQYEYLAYPSLPPTARLMRPHELFHYAISTPYFLAYKRVWHEESCRILDAGCGTGLSTVALATANPTAQVLGIDFSTSALRAAEERIAHHRVENVQLKEMALENIDEMDGPFDYINCEEVLYMVERPRLVLSKLVQLLKEGGIIRFNCHHIGAREPMLRAQEIFRMMGLMAENPEEAEVAWVCNFMEALKPSTEIRQRAWDASHRSQSGRSTVLLNHLMVRDKGWTVEELFGMIDEQGLDFIGMVNWPTWELERLFQGDLLPEWLVPVLARLSKKDHLILKSLIDPRRRLLDVWCGRNSAPSFTPRPAVRGDNDTIVHLHPILRRDKQFRELCRRSVLEHKVLDIAFVEPVHIDPVLSAVLLPLFDGPRSLETLATLAVVREAYRGAAGVGQLESATTWLRTIIERLASPLYLLIENPYEEVVQSSDV